MNWAVWSFVLVGLALAGLFAAFERGRVPSRSLGLVAALAGLAVAGRLAFAPLPNIKPTTDIVLIAGFTLGAMPGFTVGAVAALVSNMAFGQGPWTPWQMLAWGLVGVVGAAAARACSGRIDRWGLAALGALCGLMFGLIMDVSQWVAYGGEPTAAKFAAYSATSLPWNVAHALGNAAFAIAFGPLLISGVRRARARLEPEWLPIGSRLPAIALPALIAVAAVPAVSADHVHAGAASTRTPLGWLLSAQNQDGGFGNDRGGSSAPMTTGWSALAIAASGRRLDVTSRGGGLTVMERLMADAHNTDDAGAEQRMLLAVVAGGGDPRGFAGRDLVAKVASRIGRGGFVRSGSGQPAVNLTAFAVLALTAAGGDAGAGKLGAAARWLVQQQQGDGGWGPYAKGAGGSDVDDTAAVIEALAAAGVGRSAQTAGARYIERARSSSGGFPLVPGQQPNSQSTAWAVQATIARTGSTDRRAVAWLRGRVAPDGRIAYAPGSFQTPVWVTSQALLALSGKALPLAPPPTLPGQGTAGGPDAANPVPEGDQGAVVAPVADTELARLKRTELARAKRVVRAKAVAIAAAKQAGTLVGAFVKAFGGGTR